MAQTNSRELELIANLAKAQADYDNRRVANLKAEFNSLYAKLESYVDKLKTIRSTYTALIGIGRDRVRKAFQNNGFTCESVPSELHDKNYWYVLESENNSFIFKFRYRLPDSSWNHGLWCVRTNGDFVYDNNDLLNVKADKLGNTTQENIVKIRICLNSIDRMLEGYERALDEVENYITELNSTK